ncbi:bloodthirsty-related gene family, member 2 [Cyprinodon tularosa]|uniref:bloodthirsty-related gene family, member 2 n=1 Tax=Cyprinodon tularosa TaxID=77115 RepID=UPI0018E237E6|nr:bloodthirsty-related gene family, member 2 [Cyprinodon tularosa]XP_038158541.1 bloodthirsty-related gene family, member 2 [Cyprinodon tularosa]
MTMSNQEERTVREMMGSSICLVPEKHLLCLLCRNIFTNPVTIPCGHSFCLSCLSQFWTRRQAKYCPDCRRLFANKPDLSVNHILADVCENYRRAQPQKPPDEETVTDVQQMIQDRLHKIERLKSSLEVQKSSYLREVRESQKVFSALVCAMETTHKAVVSAIESKQKEEEQRVQKLIREIKEEIEQLRNHLNQADPQDFDQSEGMKQVVSLSEMKDWSRVSIESDPCVGVTRRAMSDLLEKIKLEVNRLSKAEQRRLERYTVELNLSGKTAHPFLSVSDDRKQVRHTNKLQEVPDHPTRFDRVANVLAKEGFSSGRVYWEVEVGDKIEWNLGVARQSINRKGKFTVCPANGFWTLSLKAGGQYIANTSPVTFVALEQRPKTVAVFLDYAQGFVSFFCAESGVHIYTFTDRFTDRLYPIFSPGRLHGGKNAAPLIITSSFCSI